MEKRIIGIDFGTSTSVVRAKNYSVTGEDWKSLDRNIIAADSVTFNNGAVMVPTLVQKVNDSSTYFGYDAAMSRKGAVTYQNFKVELKGENSENAKALTEEFIGYLYKSYKDQRDGGYMGDVNAEEKTIISYPVKWDKDTREFMINAAKKAGFKNVEGMDEAQASITAVTVLCRDMLEKKQYIAPGNPVNIMLIDMGAGTTDIVICRYTHGQTLQNEILCTWPQSGDILFGGRELDGILKSYITEKVPEEHRAMFSSWINDMEYKVWKEANVSDMLAKNGSVTTFDSGEFILEKLNAEMEPFTLDRKAFEDYTKEYLAKFSQLVKGSIEQCVENGTLRSGNDIDLVILTGGHSQWYFVREMLLGKALSLDKLKADPERIIDIAKPQETVALGLVYSKLAVDIRKAGEIKTDSDTIKKVTETAKKIAHIIKDAAETRAQSNPKSVGMITCPSCHKKLSLESITDYPVFMFYMKDEEWIIKCPECHYALTKELEACTRGAVESGREWDDLQKVLAEYFSHVPLARPTKNMPRFRQKLGISANETVYYHYDTTLLRSGAEGFAVCRQGLKHHGGIVPVTTISWAEFLVYGCRKHSAGPLCLGDGSRHVADFSYSLNKNDDELFTGLLKILRQTEYFKLITAKLS